MSQNNQNKSQKMSSNSKYMIIAGVAIVVVIVLAIALSHGKKAAPAAAPTDAAMTDTTSSDTKASSTKAADNGQSAWDAVLAKYSGRVIVFDAACNATPTDHVQARGSTMLLANNSDVSHNIIYGATDGVTIGAHHYKTVTIRSSDVAVVSCDSNTKAATITVK
jgi:hypothetical protein